MPAAPVPETSGTIGPILVLDEVRDGVMHLSALFVGRAATAPEAVEASGRCEPASVLVACGERALWRARFQVPAFRSSSYTWKGCRYELAAGLEGDLRIAFVSCNGEENSDLDRDGRERNVMWARLAE